MEYIVQDVSMNDLSQWNTYYRMHLGLTCHNGIHSTGWISELLVTLEYIVHGGSRKDLSQWNT